MDGRIREEDQACPFCPVKDAEIERLRYELDRTYKAFGKANEGCCKAQDEIGRLRAALRDFDDFVVRFNRHDPLAQGINSYLPPETLALLKIAREGR
jgi:hypothetical protein